MKPLIVILAALTICRGGAEVYVDARGEVHVRCLPKEIAARMRISE